MFIEWKEEFSVGVEEIDRQHMEFIRIINEVHEDIEKNRDPVLIGRILESMIKYSETHFKTEEDLMSRHGFPGYAEHKEEHDLFRRQARDLYEKSKGGKSVVSLEVAIFLRSWLESHLLEVDRKYVGFFNEKGVH